MKRYTCPYCNQDVDEIELVLHMLRKHPDKKVNVYDEENKKKEIPLSDVEKYFKKAPVELFSESVASFRDVIRNEPEKEPAYAAASLIAEKVSDKKPFPCCEGLTNLDVKLLYDAWVHDQNMGRIAVGQTGWALKEAFEAGLCECMRKDRIRKNYDGGGKDPLDQHRAHIKKLEKELEELLGE